MLRTLSRLDLWMVFLVLTVRMGVRAATSPPSDFRFRAETLAVGLSQPMELERAPDGRIFLNEITGRLRIWKLDGTLVEAGTIPVFNAQENGFLGFALDPDFKTNHGIYIYYSPTIYSGQRLSHFVMRDDVLDLASEHVVLEFGEQRKDCCHHAGSVEFAPDGNLFVSTGDNTHPGGDSDGYAPIDERPGRDEYDAQDGPANTQDLRGKILRIRPNPAGGYSIPEGNLFPKDGSQGRPEIYVMGCRNPWRMSVDQKTGIVYWGEVGPDAGGDGPRGSRGYDELNQAKRPGFFGWPYFVGPNAPYHHYDFASRQIGEKFDPLRPVNEGRSNTGAKRLPPAQPALIYWPYGDSKEFPMLGSGGRTACAGPVFRFEAKFKDTGGFPEYFDNCLLFYDWQRPFMKWARLDTEANLVGVESFTAAVTLANSRDQISSAERAGKYVIRRPVDSQFGPDGCLYLLDYGETWGVNADARLVKISYQWGNLAPVPQAQSTPRAGREPLTLDLSSDGSRDLDGEIQRYEWRLHPGDQLLSSLPNPRITLTEPGNYVVELIVADREGAIGRTRVSVTVGNTPPLVRFLAPKNGDFFTPGAVVRYQVGVTDPEDGNSQSDDELMDSRVFVNTRWSRGDGRESVAEPGLALMKQADCFNCHAVETRIVGPPLLDVANKYRGQTNAMAATVERVIKGSTGIWGQVPMLPHEALTSDQVQLMVRWIYGLEPGKSVAGVVRGLAGEIAVPQDEGLRTAILEATYTDFGRGLAASLSSETSVTLRSRRLQAEAAEEKHGLQVLGAYLGAIADGHFARFQQIRLSDSTSVTFRVASAGEGGKIELRAGARTGPILAEVEIQPTGGWEKWVELKSPLNLAGAPERADLYVVFLNPGKSGLMNLDWLQLNEK